MKFFLLQPPFEDFYATDIRLYPLGLIYLGSFLTNNGHEVMICDALSPLRRKTIPIPKPFSYLKKIYSEKEVGPLKLFGAYYRFGISDESILQKIRDFGPDVIAISSNFTAYFSSVGLLIELIHERFPSVTIMLGGYHPSTFREQLHQQYPFVLIPKDETDILRSLQLPVVEDFCFSSISVNRHLIPAENYTLHKQRFIFLVTSRGCPHDCSFCTVHALHGRSFIQRSVKDIIAEMDDAYLNHGIRVFDFEDDNLSWNSVWFESLLLGIVHQFSKRDIRLYAMNGISIEHLNEPLLRLMQEAGFKSLNLSLVTAQDQSKKRLGRPFFNETFEAIVRLANSLGFKLTAYFILGLPGETRAEVQSTIDYLKYLPVLMAPSIFYPPPGSKLYSVPTGYSSTDYWLFCRSSVLPVETDSLSRQDMIDLFLLCRLVNFEKEMNQKYGHSLPSHSLNELDIKHASEEMIGLAQLDHFYKSGQIVRVYKT